MAVARERVFDVIWYIPLEFERLSFYGGLLCMDAVLGVVTSLPVRVVCQTTRMFFSPAVGILAFVGLGSSGGRGVGSALGGGGRSRMSTGGGGQQGEGSGVGGRASSKRRSWGFHPYAREHLSDSLWLLMLAAAVCANQLVDVSMLYHYIRGQEVIKLYLAISVLECFDKLCCAFNCHVLDALQNSVYIVVNTAAAEGSVAELAHACFQLSFDAALTMMATVAHTMIILTHAVTLSVAINSHTNAMLLLLISNNFGEIKGHVFKRMDADKLFAVARMDIVERVHLSICLLFVAAQRVTAAGSLAGGLTRKMLVDSLMVLGSEVGVDIFKHAFMSKFNNLRPKVYRGFFRQLCREHVNLAQSYKLHRVVGFVPIAPAAVLIKVLPDLYRTLAPPLLPGERAAKSGLHGGGGGNGGSRGAWGFYGGGGGGGGTGIDIAAGEGSWSAWVDTARLELGAGFQRVVPNPREAGAFLLAFLALVVFKLAFGMALHWFGVFMLENLPEDHHTSGGGVGGGHGVAGRSSSASIVLTSSMSEGAGSRNGGAVGGGSDNAGDVLEKDKRFNRAGVGSGSGGGGGGAGCETHLPRKPNSPKAPHRHRLWVPF
jgi:uncharacterized membrane protein YgcG